ncbi:MAG: lysophospholipid acyltransferase family protein [Candidatus Eisenbacteria bacterium]|uniref:Lysophospholipid acyltransferase family protein n=1 Tax=Eiseniibacteriota bacterium TaxID=2212470 RepID=A0A538TA49_UNCEI|nr:MAG: lysophospholipid acyltransferase family protein [Candidatus Eisenbacteria bacterium]
MGRSPLRPLRQKLEVAALHSIGLLARVLPFRWTSAIGAALGLAAFAVMGRRRRIAIENITAAFGPDVAGKPARELARRTFVQIGRSFMEFLALPRLGHEGILHRVELIGFEPTLEWARQGKGAVMVTAHYGNWELCGAALRAAGGPMRYLLPPQSNRGSDEYFDRIRARLGIEAVKIGYGMRGALKALRQGAFLGMLPDQDARRVGIHVPFFGRPASTHTGPARLAYRAGCPIAIGLIEREPGARFRSRLVATLAPDPSTEESIEVERLTRAINEAIEAAVRRRPDHWYWLHRRWKTPPPTS